MSEFVINLLVTSVIDIVGFGVTIWQVKKHLKYEKQKPIDDYRRKLYETCYADLELFTVNKQCIFSEDYIKKALEYKAKIKLEASPLVGEKFKNCWNILKRSINDIDNFDKANDPFRKEENIEYVYNEERGEEIENYHVDDHKKEIYQQRRKLFCENSKNIYEYEKALKELLNAMRLDFGCEMVGK